MKFATLKLPSSATRLATAIAVMVLYADHQKRSAICDMLLEDAGYPEQIDELLLAMGLAAVLPPAKFMERYARLVDAYDKRLENQRVGIARSKRSKNGDSASAATASVNVMAQPARPNPASPAQAPAAPANAPPQALRVAVQREGDLGGLVQAGRQNSPGR